MGKSIEELVVKIKEEMLSSDVHRSSLVSPSAYDTAWVAMIPHPDRPGHALFPECLDWIVGNQREEGFWGETAWGNVPTRESLSTSIACMVALHKWSVGSCNVRKGLAFVGANIEQLLRENGGGCPHWFFIVFPAMLELAHTNGLNVFPGGVPDVVKDTFLRRQNILQMEECYEAYDPPLLSYLEALPPSLAICHDKVLKYQNEDGSLFRSPSATAYAFIVTRNKGCRMFLASLLQRCGNGSVPSFYPIDKELMKLCLVDRLERLGVSEHFMEEIQATLDEIYSKWVDEESRGLTEGHLQPIQIYKDSLAFRLLRMHGYRVSPRRICWFLEHEEIKSEMELKCENLLSVMLNVHRATDVAFLGEDELEEARSFSRKLLEMGTNMRNTKDCVVTFNFQREIEHELELPWLARLDHLEHRFNIEGSEFNSPLWVGKASYYRLSCLNNTTLLQLAKENYENRQLIFRNELEELKRWSIDSSLRGIGFGREKTTYCYLAVAASASHPSLSNVRLLIAKSAILVTVADDFFDMVGSLDSLNALTEAIRRWEGKGLSDYNRVIFDALQDVVDTTVRKLFDLYGVNAKKHVRELWQETFMSWLKEAEWSRKRHNPSTTEYIETGMTSIAAQAMILPATYLLCPELPLDLLQRSQANTITKLLMLLTRLLNDMQSYEKEIKDGKTNLVLLLMKDSPKLDIEDSLTCVRQIIEEKKKEFLELVLVDGISRVPKPCRLAHLWGLKAFQMFFNSGNGFDSETELIDQIKNAIYEPLPVDMQSALPQQPLTSERLSEKYSSTVVRAQFGSTNLHDHGGKKFPQNSSNETFKIRPFRERQFFPLRFPGIQQSPHKSSPMRHLITLPRVTKPLFLS